MEILDKEYKKQTTRVYFGVPLYYWIGAVAFVVMNQVNLLYWNPEILEFLVLPEIENLWFMYGVYFMMITHFPLVVIFLLRYHIENGMDGFIELISGGGMILIMSFLSAIGICVFIFFTVAFFYLPMRFMWLNMYDGSPILQSRLIVICMQFIASLFGGLVAYKMLYKLIVEET